MNSRGAADEIQQQRSAVYDRIPDCFRAGKKHAAAKCGWEAVCQSSTAVSIGKFSRPSQNYNATLISLKLTLLQSLGSK